MKDLYSYIEEWKNKPYFDEFKTLVDMTYELQERQENSGIQFFGTIEENVKRSFRGLKIAIKDAKENYCPHTSVSETSKTILSTIIMHEKLLNWKINRPKG